MVCMIKISLVILVNQISYKPINNIAYKFIVINHFDYMSKATQICLKLLSR